MATGFNFKPFSTTFQEIPGREEEFKNLKELFQQDFDKKVYPFMRAENNPIVDYGKNEKSEENLELYCNYEVEPVPETPKNAGIDPEDTEVEKTKKKLEFEREMKRILDIRIKRGNVKERKKNEKETAMKELRDIGKNIKSASDAFVAKTDVDGDADLRIRKTCCCPNYKVVKLLTWNKNTGLECPNPTPKNPQGIGMCSPFSDSKKKNFCAWQFQQFCSYDTKEKYITMIKSPFCFETREFGKWKPLTPGEKEKKIKEYYNQIEKVREEVRLEIANNINAYFRYIFRLKERNLNNIKSPTTPQALEQNKSIAMRITLRERLKEMRLREVQVLGDGNCQFRALSEQLYGNEASHKAIRVRIVDHLRDNETKYAGFVEGTYKKYVDEKSRDGSWGDNTTLQVFANIHNLRIILYTDYEDDWDIKILPRDDDGEELEFRSTIRLSFYSEWHYNSVRDVSERTPSPPPSVSTAFEDLTSPQRKKELKKQDEVHLYYSRKKDIENLRKRKRKSEKKTLKRYKVEKEAEANLIEVSKKSSESFQRWDDASNMPWNKGEKNKLGELKLIHYKEEKEAEEKRDKATKAREEAEQELKSIIEQVEKEEEALEEELARIRNNPTTPDELRENLEQMRLESNNDDYDEDYDEDNDDDKKSNRSGCSSANSFYSGEAVEAIEEIHKKKQKIAVKKHEAILDRVKLNHERELEKKENELNEQRMELVLARQLRHDYEDLEKANEDLKSLNENQEKKMDELNKKNEDLKSLNKELRKAIEMKELKSNKENKKSISFEDLENLDKTKEENKKLKESNTELNNSHDELNKKIEELQTQYREEVKRNRDEMRQARERIQQLKQQIDELEEKLANLQEENARLKLNGEAEEAQKAADEATKKAEEAKKEEEKAAKEAEEKVKRAKKAEEELEALKRSKQ